MMTTPWGEIEVSDAHVHFFSPAFFQSLAEQKGEPDVGSLLGWEVPESSEYLADRWVVELNHNNVQSAVLIASIPGDVESVGVAVERHPERFHSVVMMNPLMPGADIRCANALRDGQINGIFLFPAMHRYSMEDHHVHSLLAIVAGFPGRRRVRALRHVERRVPQETRASFSLRHALFEPHRSARGGARVSGPAVRDPALRRRLFSRSPDGGRPLPQHLFRYLQFESLDALRAFCHRSPAVYSGPRSMSSGQSGLLFGTDSSWFPRGWVRDCFRQPGASAGCDVGIDAEAARGILGGNLRAPC